MFLDLLYLFIDTKHLFTANTLPCLHRAARGDQTEETTYAETATLWFGCGVNPILPFN